jgi:cytidylate kinase
MIIAIDGPAGAGKSTVARRLAARLRFRYLDTGAMYRALAWLALERGVPLEDGAALGRLAAEHPVGFDAEGGVTVAGTDVTVSIREPRIDRVVSRVAAHPDVRMVMRRRQRELASEGDAVVEGRDIGTAVAPQAEIKVYLVADPDERVRRRVAERPRASAAELRARDASDVERMQPAADAQLIDTTALGIDEVVERIERLVHARAEA